MKKTQITVVSEDSADAALVSAALNLYFRRMGVMPVLTTGRHAELLALGADEWTVVNNVRKLFLPPDDGDINSQAKGSVEIVDQPKPVDAMQAQAERMLANLRQSGLKAVKPVAPGEDRMLCECDEPKEHVGACDIVK